MWIDGNKGKQLAYLIVKPVSLEKVVMERDHQTSQSRICTLFSITSIILKAKGRLEFVPLFISSSWVDESSQCHFQTTASPPAEVQFKGKEQYPSPGTLLPCVLYKKN